MSTAAPGEDPLVGTVLDDRYRIVRRLGEGGMGIVYETEHVVLGKRMALKVLIEDFARKSDLVERFKREARAASSIGHENIIDISDFGQLESGSVYFVMEYLDGSDLSRVLRTQGAMPWERAQPILLQVCDALSAAHQTGIIHRDLKPENIFLIEKLRRHDFVKVLDFGIAKIGAAEGGESQRLTKTGMIFGTPEYMSPEQARGDRPDHRVDIYAVGVIAYEIMSGDVPFRAESFMGVLTKHMFEPPLPPRERRPDLDIPDWVEATILRAMAKDRDQRFQSMDELGAALGGGQPVSAPVYAPRPTAGASPAAYSTAPTIAGAQAARPTAFEGEIARGKTRTGLYIGGGAAALAAGVAAFLFLRPGPQESKPEEPPAAAQQSAAAPAAPGGGAADKPPAGKPEVVKPDEPVQVDVVLRSDPAGADVVDGYGRTLGVTTLKVSLDRSEAMIAYTLRKEGYVDERVEVVPNISKEIQTNLRRKPREREPARPAARPEPAAPEPRPAARPKAPSSTQPVDIKNPFE